MRRRKNGNRLSVWRSALLLVMAPSCVALRTHSTRRQVLAVGAALPFVEPALASAAEGPALSAPDAPALGLRSALECTLSSSNERRPPVRCVQQLYDGLNAPDVYYPDWFDGRWRASSTLVQVLAPAGPELFSPGRNGSLVLSRAREGVGAPPLVYDVRWVQQPSGEWVVDREFNLGSITRASMGPKAVQDIRVEGADRCTLFIQPLGAPGGSIFRADLRVIGRRAEPVALERTSRAFDCAETVRQTVVLVPGERSDPSLLGSVGRAPMVKEVETVCTYDLEAPGRMRGASIVLSTLAFTLESTLEPISSLLNPFLHPPLHPLLHPTRSSTPVRPPRTSTALERWMHCTGNTRAMHAPRRPQATSAPRRSSQLTRPTRATRRSPSSRQVVV